MSSKFLYTAKVTWRQRLSESAGMGGYPIFRLNLKNAVKQGCFHIPPSRTAMLNVGCWLDVGYCLSLHGGQHLPKLLAADFQWLLNSLQLATTCGNLANVLPNAMDSNDSNDSNDGFQCIAMDFNGLQWIPCSLISTNHHQELSFTRGLPFTSMQSKANKHTFTYSKFSTN